MPLKPFNYRLNYNKLTNDCQGFLKNCEKNQFIADNNRVSLAKLNFFYYFCGVWPLTHFVEQHHLSE